ncbi:MAG: hypothetical protein M3O61_03365 [Gemmatimonadota bacterium]|nr:hypothetical protein [Gemmatimonadota bacterium]
MSGSGFDDNAYRNASNKLPAGEIVRLNSIRVTEIFLPSHIEQLFGGLQKLGLLDAQGPYYADDIRSWISISRSPAGRETSYSIGVLVKPGWSGTTLLPTPRTTEFDLPASIDFIAVELAQVFPSVTSATFECFLSDDTALSLSGALAADYQPVLKALHNSNVTIPPDVHRTEAVARLRAELRAECSGVLSRILPGFFAEQGTPKAFPSVEFITVDQTDVIPVIQSGDRQGFITALGISRSDCFVNVPSVWQGYLGFRYPGYHDEVVLLSWSREVHRSDRNIILLARAGDLVRGIKGGAPGRGARTRYYIPNRLFALVAVRDALADVTHEVGNLRDSLAPSQAGDYLPSGSTIHKTEVMLGSLGADFRPLISEALDSDAGAQLGIELPTMTTDLPTFTALDPKRNSFPLPQMAISEIQYFARRLDRALDDGSATVKTLSSLVSADASEKVAAVNLSLQRWTMAMTFASVVLAGLALWIGWLQLQR